MKGLNYNRVMKLAAISKRMYIIRIYTFDF